MEKKTLNLINPFHFLYKSVLKLETKSFFGLFIIEVFDISTIQSSSTSKQLVIASNDRK